MIAALPWYDFQEIQAHSDALWSRVRAGLIGRGLDAVPTELDRTVSCEDLWTHPDLLLGQACGYDAVLPWRDQLQVVAAPRFSWPGCAGHHYRSFVVVHRSAPQTTLAELRGTRCAINTPTSHSGMNALRAVIAPLAGREAFFSSVEVSGAHEISADWITRGRADVAAIDCVSYALLERYRPTAVSSLRILYITDPAPAPPFVTSRAMPSHRVEELRTALAAALPEPALGLAGITALGADDYLPIARLEKQADGYGYRELPGR